MKNNKLEQFKSNPYKAIEKLAKRKSEWLKDFKGVYAKNREDKKPKKHEAFHKMGQMPKKIIN